MPAALAQATGLRGTWEYRALTHRRAITLSDGIILVGATAVAFAGVRQYISEMAIVLFKPPVRGWTVASVLVRIPRLSGILMPFLIVFTPAVLLLRLRQPRVTIRRLFLQPGSSACGAVCLTILISMLRFCVFAGRCLLAEGRNSLRSIPLFNDPNRFWLNLYDLMSVRDPVFPAYAICCVWSLLAISRLFRAERSWIDYIGRIIGGIWIAMFLCEILSDQFPYLFPSLFPDFGEGFQ
jgi:hypothetical protein